MDAAINDRDTPTPDSSRDGVPGDDRRRIGGTEPTAGLLQRTVPSIRRRQAVLLPGRYCVGALSSIEPGGSDALPGGQSPQRVHGDPGCCARRAGRPDNTQRVRRAPARGQESDAPERGLLHARGLHRRQSGGLGHVRRVPPRRGASTGRRASSRSSIARTPARTGSFWAGGTRIDRLSGSWAAIKMSPPPKSARS